MESKQDDNESKPHLLTVRDYNELEALQKIEGREVIVLYTNFIYQVIRGEWQAVGRVDTE